MRLLIVLLRVSRRLLVLAILAGIAGGASAAGLIAVINSILNAGTPVPAALLTRFIGVVVLVLVTNYCARILLARLTNAAILDLRIQFSRQILGAPLRRLEEIGAARIHAALTEDSTLIGSALLSLANLCINVASVVVCLIYLGVLSWQVLVASILVIAFGMYSYRLIERTAERAVERSLETRNVLFQHFRALTDGIKELKLHHARRLAFFHEQLQPMGLTLRRYQNQAMAQYTAGESWAQLLLYISLGLLLFVLPRYAVVTPQVLISSTLIFFYIMEPLAVMLYTVPDLIRANISLQVIESLGLSLTDAAEPATEPRPPANWSQLDLVGVNYTYQGAGEDTRFVLGPIDASFRPGEIVFVVGGNGSGKTTFAKLLTGLYTPDSGEICVDGRRISDQERESYRQMFSAIFGDFYLFDQLLGLHPPELDTLAQTFLAELDLSHKVTITNGALSTTALSQGQRKRLALLTAYLEDRPIYLFDEWAADQDPSFREVFYREVLPQLKRRGKSVIAITHDDRYFGIADRIIRLEYGKLRPEPVAQV